MSDDAFHEIQLNGKQLIFLCMTAALVLVVAFLSGVLVGRGVRAQKDGTLVADGAAAVAAPAADPTAGAAVPAGEQAAPQPLETVAPPTPADEDLTYEKRLGGKQPQKDVLPPAEKAAEPPAAARQPPAVSKEKDALKTAPPAAAPVPAKATPVPAKAATPAPHADASKAGDAAKAKDVGVPGEPAGGGYYLKISAHKERAQADAVARRLAAKGYASFVVQTPGRHGLFSVRVGKYKTRHEAESIKQRLEKEEQSKPLISR
jgi:cell division protein FtsN